MKYFMFVATDPEAEEWNAEGDNIEEWVTEMVGRGVNIGGDRLRPVEEQKTVRVRDGKVLVTDGPFSDTKEFIAGYDLLECADLDEAIEVASTHPMARFGQLELRPLFEGD